MKKVTGRVYVIGHQKNKSHGKNLFFVIIKDYLSEAVIIKKINIWGLVNDLRSYFAFLLIIDSFIGGFVLSPIFFVGIILAILLFVTASWIVQFLIIIYLLIFGFLALFGGLILMMIYGVIMLITGILLAHNWFGT